LSQGSLDPANQIEGETPYFTIPALDLMANYFALRNMGPFIGTVCISFIAGPWFNRQSFVVRTTMWMVYGMSMVAAVLSGGRATVVFAFGLSLVVLWLRKYYRLGSIGSAEGPTSSVRTIFAPYDGMRVRARWKCLCAAAQLTVS
jgi:hypothetical protein